MPRKEKTGRVVSTKTKQTIVVAIDAFKKHPKYGKYLRRTEKFHAHDADETCNEGDLVTIIECAPISKLKTWTLKSVDERSEQLVAQ